MLPARDPARLPPTLIAGLCLDLVVLFLFAVVIFTEPVVDLLPTVIAGMALGAVSAALVTHGLGQLASERPAFQVPLLARRRWFGLLITTSSLSALLYLVGHDSALMGGAVLGTALSAAIHAVAWIGLPFLGVPFGRERQLLYVAIACVILAAYWPYLYFTIPESGPPPQLALVSLVIIGAGAIILLAIATRVLSGLGVTDVPAARIHRP